MNITQFLGALNDNIYKLLVVFFLINLKGIEQGPAILSITGIVFVLPFLLFSSSSGSLADRFSKRNIIVGTKLLELVIVSSSLAVFLLESQVGAYIILFLLATQSAIFGPSKYGIIPELVENERIPKANSHLTSFTFLAIIIGTFFASFLVDITGKSFIIASLFCTALSIIGLVMSIFIEYTPPTNKEKKFDFRIWDELRFAVKTAKEYPLLLTAIMGSSFFLFLGAYIQLNLIPYAVYSLGLTDTQGGYLFLLTAIGIGSGSLLAGKISGSSVELGIVPLAACGITICCFLLDFLSGHIAFVLPLILLLGFLGGVYLVPLESYIQMVSPKEHRGIIVATSNFFSYTGVLISSSLLYLNTEVFGFDVDKGFTVIGTITLAASIVIAFEYFDYVTRLFAMLLSRAHFKVKAIGKEGLPSTPTLFICHHTAWNDTLLILGNQRRRMHFFIQEEQPHHSKWIHKIYRVVLKLAFIPSIDPLENNRECLEEMKNCLKNGISVCIFVENPDVLSEMKKLENSYHLRDLEHAIVPVVIQKEQRKETVAKPNFFNRIRISAQISFIQT
ncbi:MAG: MFS transporter [Waddliaceae bacterium]